MAIETTFSDIRSGFSVSRSFYDAALKEQGRDGFISWFYDQITQWTHYSQLLTDFGTSERLLEALCHTSFEHENSALKVKSYERLEFLGDAVLDLMVSKKLLELYPHLEEGALSKLRGALVNEDNLAKLARTLDLGEIILLGKGEFQNNGLEKEAILSDVIESLLAVFYLEKGEVGALEFLQVMEQKYSEEFGLSFYDLSHAESFDSKTKLQETTMALYKTHPVYKSTTLEDGKFEVVVTLKDVELAKLIHTSKKKAEKLLAEKILKEKLYEEVKNAH